MARIDLALIYRRYASGRAYHLRRRGGYAELIPIGGGRTEIWSYPRLHACFREERLKPLPPIEDDE